MPDTDIGSSDYSDLTNQITDYSVDPQETDGQQDQKETTYQITNWSQYYGYYTTIPELRTALESKATWVVGGGYLADEITSMLLMTIKGNGTDSFNSILFNMKIVSDLAGDAYSEIIRDEDGMLINLKPLDPSSIVIVSNRKGQIIRYEQVSKNKQPNKKFDPKEIFHISRNRVADEIHGTSIIPSVEWIILARNEAMEDWKRVLHRTVDPLWVFHLDTDDTTEIAAFKTKMDAARSNGENMYIPKGTVQPELITTPTNSTLNPLNWINQLNDYFFQAVNVPQILIGNAKEFTDASGKIVYLAFEQSVKSDQLYFEEQILSQLNLEIKLEVPATLQNDVITEKNKEKELQASQPNDMMTELEGKQ